MELVNLTPHQIVIEPEGGERTVLPPSGQVARVAVSQDVVAQVGEIPIVATRFGDVEGLPEPRPGVLYVASTLVAQAAAAAGRRDVVSPDTGPTAVRDGEGRIVAVRRLQTFGPVDAELRGGYS